MDHGPELMQQLMTRSTCNVVAQNEYLKTHGKESKITYGPADVRFNMWVPVPVSNAAPWRPTGSKTLKDFNSKSKHWPLVSMLQLLFMFTELSLNGTPKFTVDRRKYPKIFQRLCEAHARCHMGCKGAKAEDYKLLAEYTTNSPDYDPEIPYILEQTCKELNEKEKKRGGGGGGGDEEDEEELNGNVIQFEPMPNRDEEPQQFLEWQQSTNEILRQNPNVRPTQVPPDIRRFLTFHHEDFENEHENERQERADKIERWIMASLTAPITCVDDQIEIQDSMVYLGDASKAFLIQRHIDEAENITWPLRGDSPFCEDEEEQQQDETHGDRPRYLPKINVVWYFPEQDKHHSLFCFSVLDPLWRWKYPFDFLEKHQPGAKVRKKPWEITTDPLAHLRHLGKLHIANKFTMEIYEEILSYFLCTNGSNPIRIQGEYIWDEKNNAFLPNILTLPRALDILNRCGARNLQLFDNYSNPRRSVKFPEGLLSYTLSPKMCFWYGSRDIGIGYTYWPNDTPSKNVAMELISGRMKIRDGVLEDVAHVETGSLGDLLLAHKRRYKNVVVNKERLREGLPRLLNYETGDQLMLWQAETEAALNIIGQIFPKKPKREPRKYAQYCEAMRVFRESALDKFCSIYTIDGMTDNLPVATSVKAVISHISETLRKIPEGQLKTLTLHMPLCDNDMSVFGNFCFVSMELYAKGNAIINCKIPFIAGGLLSTFDKKRVGEPKFHFQLCGPAEAGKTFPLLGFIKKNFIGGTWVPINSLSKMANYIDGHIGPGLGLCDEPPLYLTSANAEEKYYDEVQAAKNVFVDHQHNRTILKQVEVDGTSFRIQHHLNTDDFRTWAYCTNRPRNKDHPLATRMFQMTVSKPVLPPEDFKYEKEPVFSEDAKAYTKLNQALVVEVYHAIICGVIQDIDMWLFDTVTSRVWYILRKWNVIDSAKGERSLQVIGAFMRYLVIRRAVTACRHVPGGALYNVPYDPADVHKIGPYNVMTLEMIYAGLHMMSGEIIDDAAGIVLEALCKVCKYDPEKSAYENYRDQLNPTDIPFRRTSNPKMTETSSNDEKWLIDLNMLTITGTLDQISSRVAPFTYPPLEDFQVKAVLESLCKKSFPPVHGTKYRIETKPNTEARIRGNTETRPEEDFLVPCESQVAAEYQKDKKGTLSFCPSLFPLLDIGVIERAFIQATITSSFPRQKAIKGLVYTENPDLFRVSVWDDKYVESYVNEIDRKHPEAPVLRSEGIAIAKNDFLSTMEQDVLLSCRFDATRQNHDEVYWEISEAKSEKYKIIKDWEKEAAKRVAYKHGTPMDEIKFYTEEQIRQDYEAYCKEHPEALPTDDGIRYPASIIAERNARNREKKLIGQQMTEGRNIRISSELSDEQLLRTTGIRKKLGANTMRRSAKTRRLPQTIPVISNNNAITTTTATTTTTTAAGDRMMQEQGFII